MIAHSYEGKLADGRLSTGRFLAIRMVRLYPLYLLSLAVAIAMKPAWQNPAGLIRGLLMLPTLGTEYSFPLDVVYWSLFCELLVNALYVMARPVLSDRRLTGLVLVLLLMLAALACRSFSLDIGARGDWLDLASGVVRASFGIFFGVLLYRKRDVLFDRIPTGFGPLSATAVIAALLLLPSKGKYDWSIDLFTVSLLFPMCVLAAARIEPSRGAKVMGFLGAASYPLYLFHPLIGDIGMRSFPHWITANAPISGLVLAVLLIGFSALIDKRLDVPVRRKLTRVFRLSIRPAVAL